MGQIGQDMAIIGRLSINIESIVKYRDILPYLTHHGGQIRLSLTILIDTFDIAPNSTFPGVQIWENDL